MLGVTAVTLTACAAKRQRVRDPELEASPAYNDETPKWEGPSTDEPRPKTAGGAKVNEGEARRTDQYDKEATDVVLKRAARQASENCGAAKDDDGKATGPWGKVTVEIQLGHNGHSRAVTVPPPHGEKPVGRCIEKAFTNLTFPPWQGYDTKVTWDVDLVEPGKGK